MKSSNKVIVKKIDELNIFETYLRYILMILSFFFSVIVGPTQIKEHLNQLGQLVVTGKNQ